MLLLKQYFLSNGSLMVQLFQANLDVWLVD